jgi:hypothetical protein
MKKMSELADDPTLVRDRPTKTNTNPLWIGFTGIRNGMTPPQKHRFVELIDARLKLIPHILVNFVHGGAIGADEEADELFSDIIYNNSMSYNIIVWPASEARWRYWRKKHVTHTIMPPEDPLVRNRKIVDQVEQMYATPAEMSEVLRSGTWATIRYTKSQDKALTIIFPDGSVREVLNSRDSKGLGA